MNDISPRAALDFISRRRHWHYLQLFATFPEMAPRMESEGYIKRRLWGLSKKYKLTRQGREAYKALAESYT